MAVLQGSFVHSAVTLQPAVSGTKDTGINDSQERSLGSRSDTKVPWTLLHGLEAPQRWCAHAGFEGRRGRKGFLGLQFDPSLERKSGQEEGTSMVALGPTSDFTGAELVLEGAQRWGAV